MNNTDYIYDQIFKGAINNGASERNAKDHAVMGLDDFRKNRFQKHGKLIEERIKAAVKMPK